MGSTCEFSQLPLMTDAGEVPGCLLSSGQRDRTGLAGLVEWSHSLSTERGLSWARGDLGSHTEATWAFCNWLLPYRLLSAICCSWRAPSSQVRQLGSQGSLTLTEEEGDRTFRGGTGEGVSVKNRREGTEQRVEKWGENSVCWLLFGASFPGNRRKAGA